MEHVSPGLQEPGADDKSTLGRATPEAAWSGLTNVNDEAREATCIRHSVPHLHGAVKTPVGHEPVV